MAPQGLYDFGKAFLNTLCSLVPFLERELIDTLPYMCCAMLTALPSTLSQDIVYVICWHLVPFTICLRRPKDNLPLGDGEGADPWASRDNYASKSASAILMMVFQSSKENIAIHRWKISSAKACERTFFLIFKHVLSTGKSWSPS